ncbi:MAG: bifunctional (p)ppGpp synthetase/guanosine-3',5'-bis(diphosphate) 3'-pyrophosphohydrolase [Neisseriales bacterium]|nr:MAG: bifunctional (p)ppGpp synthetase/guanosine-3',5'-bis(diphosphate) 3'-pyrophosphohydrolase [Neisseriales bacterium]
MTSCDSSDHEDCLDEQIKQSFFDEAACYLLAPSIKLLHLALDFAQAAHASQQRESGIPYITHPIAVATQLLSWRMDATSITAALLHDVIEDTAVDKKELIQVFGSEVADLVDGLSKLSRLAVPSQDVERAENFRKMIIATAKDMRVIVIKLADRLHNMQTLSGITRLEKRRRIAEETLHIYAPIARRFGFHQLCRTLEDLAFQALFPNRYQVIQKSMKKVRQHQMHIIGEVLHAIQKQLTQHNIAADVMEYEKNIYRIYRKMREKKLPFFDILDMYSCQIIVKDRANCYAALGALHELYKPISNKIKDYVAVPKNNRYQGLHTTLFGPESLPIEVQIFTQAMYAVAEFGVVAYWKNQVDALDMQQLNQGTDQWLQNILAIDDQEATNFLKQIKTDLLPSELYVFTTQGKVVTLPRGATVIDFAYAISQETGNGCYRAQVNHIDKPLETMLRNGDIVNVMVRDNHEPDPAWLDFAVSHRAIFAIRHRMKHLAPKQAVQIGQQLLDRVLSVLTSPPIVLSDVLKADYLRVFSPRTNNFDTILSEVGMGYASAIVLSRQLAHLSCGHLATQTKPIAIAGNEGGVFFASCCQPIPGDAVTGLINERNGLVVHQYRCKYIKHIDPDKSMMVELISQNIRTYETAIRVLIYNELNALAQVTAAISQASASIEGVNTQKTSDNYLMRVHFRLRVNNTMHLDHILAKIGQVGSVLNVERCVV